ncbi:MAG: ABC transporter substrate-binding protein [Proteobacteria bacterium]|nr:ABC transporter substrate-binding protein [Pseudomonadota bacterium]
MRFLLVFLLGVVGVVGLGGVSPTVAHAESTPGITAVKTANDTLSGFLKQKVVAGSKEEQELTAKVATSVRGFLDIDELGRRAMVDQWGKLTKDQQDRFITVLRELIEANYIKGLRSNVNYTVDYTSETTDPTNNLVVTTKVNAQRKGKPMVIEVVYVLVKQGAKLRAWDVKTDGVGLVENYRTMFNKIIARDGFDGLIKRMLDRKAKT